MITKATFVRGISYPVSDPLRPESTAQQRSESITPDKGISLEESDRGIVVSHVSGWSSLVPWSNIIQIDRVSIDRSASVQTKKAGKDKK